VRVQSLGTAPCKGPWQEKRRRFPDPPRAKHKAPELAKRSREHPEASITGIIEV